MKLPQHQSNLEVVLCRVFNYLQPSVEFVMELTVAAQASSQWYKIDIDLKPPKPCYLCPSGLVLSVVSSSVVVATGTVVINQIRREEGSSITMVVFPYLQIGSSKFWIFINLSQLLKCAAQFNQSTPTISVLQFIPIKVKQYLHFSSNHITPNQSQQYLHYSSTVIHDHITLDDFHLLFMTTSTLSTSPLFEAPIV